MDSSHRPVADLIAHGNDPCPSCIDLLGALIHSQSETPKSRPVSSFPTTCSSHALACGWIVVGAEGRSPRLTRSGRRVLKRHRTLQEAARAKPAGGAGVRPMATHASIGPLGWLASRRDRHGAPLIGSEQIQAGERLAADLWRARAAPKITASWSGMPREGSRRRPTPGAGSEIADGVIAAKVRVENALRNVGPEHAGMLIDTCGHCLSIEEIERRHALPQRSARLALGLALTCLARHYGYLPPERGEREIARRIQLWLAPEAMEERR